MKAPRPVTKAQVVKRVLLAVEEVKGRMLMFDYDGVAEEVEDLEDWLHRQMDGDLDEEPEECAEEGDGKRTEGRGRGAGGGVPVEGPEGEYAEPEGDGD